MTELLYKRGDSFVATVDVLDNGGMPIPLAGATVRCQVRDLLDTLVANLVVTLDPVLSNRLSMTYVGDTSGWPVGTLRGDIEITSNTGSVNTTETFRIVVVDRITI